jgi:hypothetical protein
MTDNARHGKVNAQHVASVPAPADLDPDHATATMLVRPVHGLDEVVDSSVDVDSTTDSGRVQVEARADGVRDGELDLEVADESDGKVADDSEGIQRREFARVDAFGGAEKIATAAINISGSGAVVSRLGALVIGDAVSLALRLSPTEPPIQINGRIVREFGDHLRAIHFEQVHKADRERIVRYVFERQRLELKRIKRPT